jgi:hypothetical protein
MEENSIIDDNIHLQFILTDCVYLSLIAAMQGNVLICDISDSHTTLGLWLQHWFIISNQLL